MNIQKKRKSHLLIIALISIFILVFLSGCSLQELKNSVPFIEERNTSKNVDKDPLDPNNPFAEYRESYLFSRFYWSNRNKFKDFNEERKAIISLYEETNNHQENLIKLTETSNGLVEVASGNAEKYYYYGGIKNKRPDGLGILWAINSKDNKSLLYMGTFDEGKFLTKYMLIFKNNSLIFEGTITPGPITNTKVGVNKYIDYTVNGFIYEGESSFLHGTWHMKNKKLFIDRDSRKTYALNKKEEYFTSAFLRNPNQEYLNIKKSVGIYDLIYYDYEEKDLRLEYYVNNNIDTEYYIQYGQVFIQVEANKELLPINKALRKVTFIYPNGQKAFEVISSFDVMQGNNGRAKNQENISMFEPINVTSGTIYYEDGTIRYSGQLKDLDTYNGQGTSYRENGVKEYEGQWLDGKRHGQGISYNEDGSIDYKGRWEYGNYNP